jgi:hypothetical protein
MGAGIVQYKCATEGNENESVLSRDLPRIKSTSILNEDRLLGRLNREAIHIDFSLFYPLILD